MTDDNNSRDEWDAMAEVTRRPVPTPAEHDEHTALRDAVAAERAAVVAPTLLLVCPPDDPLGLLRDSVAGGRVPTMTHGDDASGRRCEGWFSYTGDCRCGARALVLSVRGEVDAIALGRAQDVVARLCGFRDIFGLGIGRTSPATLAAYIVQHTPTYRLAYIDAHGREETK
jgi:hypothetical protein